MCRRENKEGVRRMRGAAGLQSGLILSHEERRKERLLGGLILDVTAAQGELGEVMEELLN